MSQSRSKDAKLADEISVLLPTPEIGGNELMLIEWLEFAREFGLKSTIYCRPNRELTERIDSSGLRWVEVPYVPRANGIPFWASWRNLVSTWRAATQAPRETPVLLAPGAVQLALLPILACVLARRPIACYVPMTHDAATLQLSWPALRDWLTARLAARVGMWITISEEQRARLRRDWRIRAPIHVVPNRLRILARPPRRPVSRPDESSPLRVVFLGRFSAVQKGLDWLTTVLTDNPSRTSNYSFTFQGRGQFLSALEALARQLGPGRVRVVPWGDTAALLATADVLILTSRFEGLPLVAIEAIWAGVPVVATFESSLADLLPQECLFPFGDVTRFLSALDRMRSPKRREAAVAHAQEKVKMLLSESRYRESIRDVVQALGTLRPWKALAAEVG